MKRFVVKGVDISPIIEEIFEQFSECVFIEQFTDRIMEKG